MLNRIFILLPRSCPGVGLQGAGGIKNFSVGICDGAPSTARSSFEFGPVVHEETSFKDISYLEHWQPL